MIKQENDLAQPFYEGDWVEGKKQGNGVEQLRSGSLYEGMFKDGKINGPVTYKYYNGNIYQGDWVENKRTGRGKMVYKLKKGQKCQ